MADDTDSGPKPFFIREAMHADTRLVAPAAERNEAPIIGTLTRVLDDAGRAGQPLHALELASGTGQHMAAFASAFPHLHWQPSDGDPDALVSIEAWRVHVGCTNIAAPLHIDLGAADWHRMVEGPVDLIVAINLLHISPWAVTCHVLAGAQDLLARNGVLFVYGCFIRDGDWVSDGNRSFDANLKASHPEWGLRDTNDVATEAARHGLVVRETIAMPANNTVMVFGHQSPSSS